MGSGAEKDLGCSMKEPGQGLFELIEVSSVLYKITCNLDPFARLHIVHWLS